MSPRISRRVAGATRFAFLFSSLLLLLSPAGSPIAALADGGARPEGARELAEEAEGPAPASLAPASTADPTPPAAPLTLSADTLAPLGAAATFLAEPVDVEALLLEDEASDWTGRPYRVGAPLKAFVSPERAGQWDTLGAERIWRARISSPGALWLALGFGVFRLPEGAALFAFDEAGERVLGPYGHDDVRPHGQLWLPPIEGDVVLLELHWPAALAGVDPGLELSTLGHGYKPWGGLGRGKDEPGVDAGSCNIDVNCPLGDDWQDAKRGVVNLLRGGSGYCSGSLVATTSGTCQPYVLTAAHCLDSDSEAASTVFQFNFERPSCGGGTAPTDQTVSGSRLVASYAPSDMTLLEMDELAPVAFDPFFNGWDASGIAASESWAIHHPSNDEKSISYNDDPLTDGQNWGPDHWRVNDWEEGTTEPGSSGSPLFDASKRVVGQLHGGTASCTSITYDEYGKLSVSWTGGGTPASRLVDWLDDADSGATSQAGIDIATCSGSPALSVFDYAVDDASGGDGNGLVTPGESFLLPVTLLNEGYGDATNVAGTLSNAQAGVTITDTNATWPSIISGETRETFAPHFAVSVGSEHACGDPLSFDLDVSADQSPGSWPLTLEVPTGIVQQRPAFEDDIEGGLDAWTSTSPTGSNPFVVDEAFSRSPTRSWFVDDVDFVSEAHLTLESIDTAPASGRLVFWQRRDMESGYDGGILEISVNGGPFEDAQARIVEGGYNATLSTSYSNPLGGREAWSGESAGFERVVVDLEDLAWQQVRIRWRFASDSSVSQPGWWIDDVVVESYSRHCSTGEDAPPAEASDPRASLAPLRIAKSGADYELTWSAPPGDAVIRGYRLYETPLGQPVADPSCLGELGSGTSALVDSLPANRGFLVVAYNNAGEGPTGQDAAGAARGSASAPCP